MKVTGTEDQEPGEKNVKDSTVKVNAKMAHSALEGLEKNKRKGGWFGTEKRRYGGADYIRSRKDP